MTCSSTQCKERSDDKAPDLACILCLRIFHAKCVGLPGKIVDCINDSSKGLRWTCSDCKLFDIKICKMFGKLKTGFADLKNDMNSMLSKLNTYEKHFNEFNTARKQQLSSTSILDLTEENSQTPQQVRSQHNEGHLLTTATAAATVTANVSPNGITSPSPLPNAGAPGSSDNRASSSRAAMSSQTNTAGSDSATKSRVDGARNDAASCELEVVQRNKEIFLSRLTPSTSADEIAEYVRKRLPELTFTVYKFNFTYEREVASFKISMPDDAFDELIKPEFWPRGLVMREFKSKPRRNRQPISLNEETTANRNINSARPKNVYRYSPNTQVT